MLIHEINTRDKFTIEVGTPREDFLVTYTENFENSVRKAFVSIQFKPSKGLFSSKEVGILLDSFEKWEAPYSKDIDLDEYRTILYRVAAYFQKQGYNVTLIP